MIIPQATNEVALLVSVVALVVAALAAGFAWWQGYSAHRTRKDNKRVHLSLGHSSFSDGMITHGHWSVRNGGAGTAMDVQVTITYTNGENSFDFVGNLGGILRGMSDGNLVFSNKPSGPGAQFPENGGRPYGEFLSATVEYSIPAHKKRKRARIAIPSAR